VAVSRQRIYAIIESANPNDDVSRIADFAIVWLIILNIVAVTLESVNSLSVQYSAEFFWFEIFSVAVFSVEYLLRLWACVDANPASPREALKTRLRYILSVHGIIDLLAIRPFYFGMFVDIDLRFLRMLRLIRILKLTRYSPAMRLLFRAIKHEQQALSAAVFLLSIALIVAACGIYLCERAAQPEDFGSIPAAIWWAIATLSTVGYGDVTPITVGGKVFGAGVMIVGIGTVALPTGILASAFADELRRRREDFRDVVDSALDDGVITEEEFTTLEAVSAKTGLSEDEADRILQHEFAKKSRPHAPCPECGYAPAPIE
jgi:voltage-gated potassium channel